MLKIKAQAKDLNKLVIAEVEELTGIRPNTGELVTLTFKDSEGYQEVVNCIPAENKTWRGGGITVDATNDGSLSFTSGWVLTTITVSEVYKQIHEPDDELIVDKFDTYMVSTNTDRLEYITLDQGVKIDGNTAIFVAIFNSNKHQINAQAGFVQKIYVY